MFMSWFRYHILRKTFCDHRPPTRTHTHAGTCVCMCAHTCHTCRHMRPHTHMHARTHGGPASHSAPLGVQLSHSTSAPFLVTCCHVHGATDARGQPTTALSFSQHCGGHAASWERQGLHTAVPHQTCVPSASGAARGQPTYVCTAAGSEGSCSAGPLRFRLMERGRTAATCGV